MLFLTAATILAALFQVILAQPSDMKINTLSSAVVCQPVQFTWTGGAPPYFISLIPAGQPSGTPLKQFPPQNGNAMTWTVDMPAGSTFSSALKDSTGEIAYSDVQTVQDGPDDSCVGQSQSMSATAMTSAVTTMESSAASTNSATTPVISGSSERGTSTTASGSVSVTASGTAIHAVGSSTASSTSSSNAGSVQASAGAIGIAGLLGLAGAALLG